MSNVQSVDLTELALNYDDKRRMEPQDFERLVNCIWHYGKVEGDVLEIGCGSGYYLVPLAQRLSKASSYGVDITDAMLASAKGKLNRQALTNLSLAKGNAHCLPLADHAVVALRYWLLLSLLLHFDSHLSKHW